MPPTSIDGTDITGATIDGTDVTEITVDGQTVFTAGPTVVPTHHWTLDNADTSGSTCLDTVGSIDGTINGPTTGKSGANDTYTTNESYEFDGSNDTVDFGSNSIDYSQGWTIACWINTDNDHNGIFYAVETSSARVFQFKKKDAGQIQLNGVGLASGQLNTSPVSNSVWHHTVATYDGGSSATIYIDGSPDVTDTFSVSTSANQPLFFGNRDQGGNPYDGLLDDVRFYDVELTAAQVFDLYDTGDV